MSEFQKGCHRVRFVGQGFGKLPSGNCTDYFYLEFEPLGIYNPNDPADEQIYNCPNDIQHTKIWLSQKSVPYAIKRLRDLGWEGSRFSDLDPLNGKFSFANVECDMICKHRVEKQNTYYDWDFPQSGQTLENDASVARSMDQLYGQALTQKKTATKPAPMPKREPTGFNPPPEQRQSPAEEAAELARNGVTSDSEVPF